MAGAVLLMRRAQYFVDLDKKNDYDFFGMFTCSLFIFHGERNVLRKSDMCSCNLLGTLCVSDRSGCGGVLVLADALESW